MNDFDRHVRERWAARAGAYQSSYALLCAYMGEPVLDAAGVRAGSTVLDVGTGPGTLAGLAAARGATVAAVDPEPSMVSAASRLVPDVRLGALPELPFGDAGFEAVVANFVLNFVGDPGAAVRELARVAVPGGRVAVTIWPAPQPPLQRLWGAAVEASGVTVTVVPKTLDPANDFARTEDGLGALLGTTLLDVRVERVAWVHRAEPDAWWNGAASGIGQLGEILLTLSPADVARVRAAYDELTVPYLGAGGLLELPTAALLGSGVVPGP
jgi:SAM-dependent methyltransferase